MICPDCGKPCERVLDGPWGCPACRWIENFTKKKRRRQKVATSANYTALPLTMERLTAFCRVVRAALDQREAADVACSDCPPEDADMKWDQATTEFEKALDTVIAAYAKEMDDGYGP